METYRTIHSSYDVEHIRKDFPILHTKVNNKSLVYFDNAASTQKPLSVISALQEYYTTFNANIHRGIHTLAERATHEFETTREEVRKFINASAREEIIFTRGTTESINLVASSWGRAFLKPGDEILLSAMEHHSNMVPWFIVARQQHANVKIIPINQQGEVILEEYEKLLSEKVKIVSIVHASNSLGTVNPIKKIIERAHQHGAVVVVDGAQSTSHLHIDVQHLDADFFAFSGHKIYGPTGIGVLYGKKHLLEAMPPYQGGGEMIGEVTYQGFTTNELPYKFEAGTPNIADAVVLKHAIRYINTIGKDNIQRHENELLQYATEKISEISGVKIIGQAKEKISILAFTVEGVHHQDIGILLDKEGIAIRTGHHCTQPLMQRYGIAGTNRASFALYNTKSEVDYFMQALHKAIRMLR
ncbi:MAG: cysteine desulfurase [Cytophagaceae bacterium]|nr:cysteine desulfurase [Cytophagaceae bacterium]MDW8456796.1 cysteine desulfurase [Cytophagaceae bacterium]